ncbi:hypothetical protein SALBM135S_02642 [Streptomyces alboniger]
MLGHHSLAALSGQLLEPHLRHQRITHRRHRLNRRRNVGEHL